MSQRTFAIMVVMVACIAAKPTTAPAPPEQIDPLILSAVSAAQRGNLQSLVSETDARAAELVADPATIDTSAVLHLATVREFGRFFSRVGELSIANKELLAWFIDQPKLSSTVMMAISPQDPPDGLLDLLRRLHDDYGNQLNDYPELVGAFCTVWDSTGDVGEEAIKVDLDRASRLFKYYTLAKSSLRFDVKELPWQLATYAIANPLTEDEIVWARSKYLGKASLGESYFDPPFNPYPGYKAKLETPTDLLYTLPNIFKHGGRLDDRSHFAVGVCRSMGVPAGTCRAVLAEGDQGPRPSWVAVLEVNNRRVRWNFDTARQPEHRGWRGTVQDPQTHTDLSDCELAQTAELQTTSLDRRLSSVAIWKLLDDAPEKKRLELLMKAIEVSPGNLRAWRSLIELTDKRQLNDLQVDAFAQTIEKHAMKNNGMFAFEAYRAVVRARGSIQQADLLERPAKWFADQPDVLAYVRVEQGDAQRKLKRPDKALAAFREAIMLQPKNGPLVLSAMQRADVLLREVKDIPRLIEFYAAVWTRMDRPRPSPYARSTPYFLVGQAYAQALEDAGRQREAGNVRAMSEGVQADQ